MGTSNIVLYGGKHAAEQSKREFISSSGVRTMYDTKYIAI